MKYLKARQNSLRLVLSSHHVSTMRKPILMVNLSLKYEDGQTKDKVLEFDQADLDGVLKSLQSVETVREHVHEDAVTHVYTRVVRVCISWMYIFTPKSHIPTHTVCASCGACVPGRQVLEQLA